MSNENKDFSILTCIELLWKEGFFKSHRSLREVSEKITEKWGHNFSSSGISIALTKASFLKKSGKRGIFVYIQKINPISKKVQNIEEQLFSEDLINKLGDRFKFEIQDLQHNFRVSGNCTAFILRKILEKLIWLTFAKNGIEIKLHDKNNPKKFLGLEAMIDTAVREKIDGISFLLPKTAEGIKGAKFLGDTSAHNPLVNVDIETILPQMPFVIIAYKELAERL
jgi:hypothetical protein